MSSTVFLLCKTSFMKVLYNCSLTDPSLFSKTQFLPDMTNIIAVWQSLLKQEKEQEGQRTEEDDTPSMVDEITEVVGHGKKVVFILSGTCVNDIC